MHSCMNMIHPCLTHFSAPKVSHHLLSQICVLSHKVHTLGITDGQKNSKDESFKGNRLSKLEMHGI